MQNHSLHHVSLWLDDLSSNEGAFPQAMDWAYRLGLPLRVVATRARLLHPAIHGDFPAHRSVQEDRKPDPVLDKIRTWGTACSQRGVALETSLWQGATEVGIEQFLRPWGLCVFGDNQSAPLREKVLARSLGNPEVLLLLTPRASRPLTRVLILYHRQNPSAFYLESVARLCQALEVQPLILTVAFTKREARLRQSFAEGVCSSLHLQADFDSMVAYNLRSAVRRVAGWRNCSHLFVERPKSISLWQRLRGDIFSELSGLSDSLTVLALPEGVALDVPNKIRDSRLDRPWKYTPSNASRPA